MLTVKHGPFQPSLEDAFVADLAALKAKDPLAPLAVVAPSRRLADRLQRLAASERGMALLGVRFHTFHSLALEVCEGMPGRTVSDPLFHDRIVDDLLRKGEPLPRGMAGAYRTSLRDLVDAGVQGGEVKESLREYFAAAEEDWASLDRLLDLRDRYLERLGEAGVMHGSELAREAARRAAGDGRLERRYKAVLYYGFYDLTGVQADFFRAVAEHHPDVRLYFPYRPGRPAYAFAGRFFSVQLGAAAIEELPAPAEGRALGAALDALFDEEAAPVPAGPERLRLVSASGARDECWAVAKEILALREGPSPVPFEDIGVVARTMDAYRTVLPEVFRENAIPFSLPEGEPLLRHPVAKLSFLLLTLRRREFPAQSVLDIAQSPYFRREAPVASWARLLRKTGLHSGWLQWQSKVAPYAAKDYAELRDAEAAAGRAVPAADTALLWSWVEGLESALRGPAPGTGWAGMAAHAAVLLESTFEVGAGDPGEAAWAETLDAVRSLAAFDRAFPAPAWADFLDVLEERLRRATLEPGRAGRGVRVLGAMDARGDSFRHLFLIGLAEGSFPRRVEEDPLLRDSVREQLQQPGGYWILPKRSGLGGLDGYGEEKLLFTLLVSSAKERLTCVYPRSDDEGRPRVPSFYLRALCRAAGRRLDAPGDWRVERRPFAKLEALAAASPARLSPKEASAWIVREGGDPAPFLAAAGRPVALLGACLERLPALNAAGEPGPLDGIIGSGGIRRPKVFSPTALETFTACPFKYFASRVLDLDEEDEPVERGELAPWFKGKIYHDALRRFHVEALAGAWPKGADWRPALTRAFEAALEGLDWRQSGLYPVLWEAQRARMRSRLEAFVAWDLAARETDGYRPRKFETELAAEVAGIALGGRADRLDEGPGGVRVIDYKSRGGRELRSDIKSMRRLQPPLYLALVEAAGDPVAGASFYGIEDAFHGDRSPAQDFGMDDWKEARPRFLENLAGLVRWVEEGRFPIAPDESMFGACWFCPFDRVCRKAHPRTRRRAAASAVRRELDALRTLPLGRKR